MTSDNRFDELDNRFGFGPVYFNGRDVTEEVVWSYVNTDTWKEFFHTRVLAINASTFEVLYQCRNCGICFWTSICLFTRPAEDKAEGWSRDCTVPGFTCWHDHDRCSSQAEVELAHLLHRRKHGQEESSQRIPTPEVGQTVR